MSGPGIEVVGAAEMAEVLEVMQSGFLSRSGPADNPAFLAMTHRLEVEIADDLGTKHALALSGGGSAALLIAMHALGIRAGDDGIAYRRKNALLTERCEALDRDPASIIRTVGLPPLCIRDTRTEAVRVLAGILEHNALAPDEARAMADASPLVGTEADVLEALDAWAEAGAAEAVIDRPAPFDDESLRRLAAACALPAAT